MVIDVGAQNQCLGGHILNFQLKCRWVLLYKEDDRTSVKKAMETILSYTGKKNDHFNISSVCPRRGKCVSIAHVLTFDALKSGHHRLQHRDRILLVVKITELKLHLEVGSLWMNALTISKTLPSSETYQAFSCFHCLHWSCTFRWVWNTIQWRIQFENLRRLFPHTLLKHYHWILNI